MSYTFHFKIKALVKSSTQVYKLSIFSFVFVLLPSKSTLKARYGYSVK